MERSKLVEEHWPWMQSWVRRHYRYEPNKEDIAQETALKLLEMKKNVINGDHFRVIATYKMREAFRSLRRHETQSFFEELSFSENSLAINIPAENPDVINRKQDIKNAITKLDDPLKIIMAFRLEGYTLAEIAEKLGICIDQVLMGERKAIKILRKIFNPPAGTCSPLFDLSKGYES